MCRNMWSISVKPSFPAVAGWLHYPGGQLQVLRHSSLFSLLYLCMSLLSPSVEEWKNGGNGRMQELTGFYTLAGDWAPSLDFLSFLLPTIRPQTCCRLRQTINRNYESQANYSLCSFIVGRETEEMLECDLLRIKQEILDKMGYWLLFFAFLGTVRCTSKKRDPSFFS